MRESTHVYRIYRRCGNLCVSSLAAWPGSGDMLCDVVHQQLRRLPAGELGARRIPLEFLFAASCQAVEPVQPEYGYQVLLS